VAAEGDMADKVSGMPEQAKDDVFTVVAISFVAEILGDVVHEGLGHAAVALLIGAKSGVLSTVAWSSEGDSRLVVSGGTLANLVAALVFWIVLRRVTRGSVRWRFLLLASLAFNLFAGTGYFFFSGVTNFGDWAVVIDGLPAHWLWRSLLVVVGIASYFGAVLAVGTGLVRYVGVARSDLRRLRRLTWIPYFSAVVLLSVAGLLNPIGIQLMWQSALPAAAGAHSGLLWLMYYIPRGTVAEQGSEGIGRSYAWVVVAVGLSLVFIFVLGRGITVHR
jgi:hypothetical protein